jgi:AAA+ superfamily predicted ATPase
MSSQQKMTTKQASLEAEFNWLVEIINLRLTELQAESSDAPTKTLFPAPPSMDNDLGVYHQWLVQNNATIEERLALSLALLSALMPEYLAPLWWHQTSNGDTFNGLGILWRTIDDHGNKRPEPSWQTLSFLLHPGNLETRTTLLTMIHPDHRLHTQQLLQPVSNDSDAPLFRPLRLDHQCLFQWCAPPGLRTVADADFPAQELTTQMQWEDLVINDSVKQQLSRITLWLRYEDKLQQQLQVKKRIRRGYRALFYGPPGTGKSLTAALLGQSIHQPVYRIDLSAVVSKWVGETSKNLEKIFSHAQREKWLLFFDEADALFGRRSVQQNANDRHANNDVAYLLQRIEDYPGLVILASNLKDNIDEAFIRRFQTMVHFPLPGPVEREALWRKALAVYSEHCHGLDITAVAKKYSVTGATISNVFTQLSLNVLCAQERDDIYLINAETLTPLIHQELAKGGMYMLD